MNKIIFLNRTPLTVLKGLISNNQLCTFKLVTSTHKKYCCALANENKFLNFGKTNKLEDKSFLNWSSKKYLSTSSSNLSDHSNHDHSKIWNFERILSIVMLPLIPTALLYPNQQLDTILTLVMVMHTHFGLEAIAVDYIRPIIFGNVIPKIGIGLVYLFSIVTLAGLLNLIYNDCGLANTIINVWKN